MCVCVVLWVCVCVYLYVTINACYSMSSYIFVFSVHVSPATGGCVWSEPSACTDKRIFTYILYIINCPALHSAPDPFRLSAPCQMHLYATNWKIQEPVMAAEKIAAKHAFKLPLHVFKLPYRSYSNQLTVIATVLFLFYNRSCRKAQKGRRKMAAQACCASFATKTWNSPGSRMHVPWYAHVTEMARAGVKEKRMWMWMQWATHRQQGDHHFAPMKDGCCEGRTL